MNTNNKTYQAHLRAAARAQGIQASYKSNEGQIIWAPEKTLIQLCENLSGIAPTDKALAQQVLKNKAIELKEKHLPASLVAWGKKLNRFHLTLEKTEDEKSIQLKIDNKPTSFKILTTLKRKNRKTLQIQIETEFELGYHELQLLIDNKLAATSFIISAPEKLNTPQKRSWGPFLPIYALRSKDDWGIGSFKELKRAASFYKEYGADFVSVLPLLAGRFDEADCDPSPYSALTRFFWNEIYLDVDDLLKKYPVPKAVELRQAKPFQEKLAALKKQDYVDYHGVYQLKKSILLILAISFFEKESPTEYKEFLEQNPLAKKYAKFRSTEKDEQNFHLFAQFETDLALKNLNKDLGLKVYMDYPVGVNDSGFDFKENPDNFLETVSVGAPPEPVFQLGQDWGFPSFHPKKLPAQKYEYFIESLRQHLKFSKILRLDHIIGLYRIYSVPKGFGGKNGAYLRFAKEDFFAILVLEVSLFGADIIGENLGTVPPAVNEILQNRNINGMQILQIELWRKPEDVKANLTRQNLAALNTHDMPMFARFLKGEDLDEVRDLNILGPEVHAQLMQERKTQLENWQKIFLKNPLFEAIRFLAQSECRYLVINPEDLWGEERPQNIPGTWKEVPNWRRKMRLSLEEWPQHVESEPILRLLRENIS